MLTLKRLLSQTLVPVLLAFVGLGCASSIAARHPHLERRAVCVRPQEIEPDSLEYLFSQDNVPVSNFHPEVVDRIAPSVRTVFEFDPGADPSSVSYLPAPFNELECAPVFSMLPSKDAETAPLPEASVDLLVHEPRPEPVPRSVADKLASCATLNRSPLQSDQYTMTFNVYVRDDGQAVSALLVESTLGDRPTERCIVDVLGSAQWPTVTAHLTAASEPGLRSAFVGLEPAEAPLGVRSFFAQPAPNQPAPPLGDRPSGVYRIQPQPPPVSVPAGGARIPPSVFVIPMGTVAVAVLAFGVVYYLSSNDAPAWSLTMNPMTGKRYTSQQEYDEVQGRAAKKLLKRPPLRIAAIQSQPPPAPAPPPALTPQEQREQEKKQEKCGKLATKIKELMEAKRDPTPEGGFPQGRKGVIERWREMAENKGKWQPQPDGKPSKRMQGHLDAYEGEQRKLVEAIDNWDRAKCDDKEHGLPRNARQYAAQTPEYGPGKPLEPAPLPKYEKIPIPPAIAPLAKKGSK